MFQRKVRKYISSQITMTIIRAELIDIPHKEIRTSKKICLFVISINIFVLREYLLTIMGYTFSIGRKKDDHQQVFLSNYPLSIGTYTVLRHLFRFNDVISLLASGQFRILFALHMTTKLRTYIY